MKLKVRIGRKFTYIFFTFAILISGIIGTSAWFSGGSFGHTGDLVDSNVFVADGKSVQDTLDEFTTNGGFPDVDCQIETRCFNSAGGFYNGEACTANTANSYQVCDVLNEYSLTSGFCMDFKLDKEAKYDGYTEVFSGNPAWECEADTTGGIFDYVIFITCCK